MQGLLEDMRKNRQRKKIKERDQLVFEFSHGVISSAGTPQFSLIWFSALVALARRFMRGVRVKKDAACNALSNNQDACTDKAFIINRLEHGIEHCYKAIGRISGQLPPEDEMEVADGGDAGAIMFSGALLAEYYKRTRGKDGK